MTEDFTTWSESDVPGRLSQTSARSTFAGLNRNDVDVWLRKDYGSGYFKNFVLEFELYLDACALSAVQYNRFCYLTLANALDDWKGNNDNSQTQITLMCAAEDPNYSLQVGEGYTGSATWGNRVNISLDTLYFVRLTKTGTSFSAEIYSGGSLIGTSSMTLSADHSLRFIMCPQSQGLAGSYSSDGYVEDLYLGQTEDLFAEFQVRKAGTEDLFAEMQIRQETSRDLFAKFHLQRIGTGDLFAKFEIQDSEDLFAEFNVRQETSQDLYAKFQVRREASQELYAKFQLQDSEDLFSEFIVRNTGTRNLFSKFMLERIGTQDLYAKFQVVIPGSEDLFSSFEIRHSDAVALKGFFIAVFPSEELFCKFAVRHTTWRDPDLKAIFTVKNPWRDLFSKFEIRRSSSEDLKTILHVGQDSADLKAKFHIGQNSQDLKALFYVGQDSRSLKAIFQVGQDSADLKAIFNIDHSVDLKAIFNVQHWRDLKAVFRLTRQDLFAKFHVGQNSRALFAKTRIRHLETAELKCVFTVRHSSSRDLLGSFVVQRFTGTADLKAIFTVAQGYADLKAVIRRVIPSAKPSYRILRDDALNNWMSFRAGLGSGFIEFPTFEDDPLEKMSGLSSLKITSAYRDDGHDAIRFGWVYGVARDDLKAVFMLRRVGARDLYAKFGIQKSLDLFAKFRLRQDFKDLKAVFTVMADRVTLIAEEVLASDQSTIDITGLDLNTHKFYDVILETVNNYGSVIDPYIFFNNDTTKTNYHYLAWFINATGGSATVSGNEPRMLLSYINPNRRASIILKVTKTPDNYITAQGKGDHHRGNPVASGLMQWVGSIVYNQSQSNLTRITIQAQSSGVPVAGFKAGTKLRIYGYKET